MAEGSMWEALDKAAYYGLGNLTAIVDVNRLGQRGRPSWNGTWTPTSGAPRRSAVLPS
jgi:transketolase